MIYKVRNVRTREFLGSRSFNKNGKQWKRKYAAVDAIKDYIKDQRRNRNLVNHLDYEIVGYELEEKETLDILMEIHSLEERRAKDAVEHERSRLALQAKNLEDQLKYIKGKLKNTKKQQGLT